MNVSSVGVASAFEGARVASQQQASSTASASQTKQNNAKQAEEADLKQTDTVTEHQESSNSGQTNPQHRVNLLT